MSDQADFPPPQGPRHGGATGSLASDAGSSPAGDIWQAPSSVSVAKRAALPVATEVALPAHIPEITGSVALDIPDATGAVVLSGLDGAKPRISVGGAAVKVGAFGSAKIPMKNGRVEVLSLKSFLPGFPIATFRGKVLYKSPQPSVAENVVCALIFLACVASMGVFLGGVVGIFAGRGYAGVVKSRAAVWARLVFPAVLSVAVGAWSIYVKAQALN